MNTYQNLTFSGKTVDLDDCVFRQCVFEDCFLRFSATGMTELSGCNFTRSKLVPDGAAQLTLSYLRAFYFGLGEWGRDTVDGLFETVRRPDSTNDASDQAVPAIDAGAETPSRRSALEAFGATPEGQAVVHAFSRLSEGQRGEIAALIGRAARQTP